MTFRRRSRGRSGGSSCASARARHIRPHKRLLAPGGARESRTALPARIVAAAIACALIAGCASGSGAGAATHMRAAKAATCFRASGHHDIAGELVDIPAHAPKRPPLLLVMHGLREPAFYIAGETAFDDIADQHGFVVAYPNALTAQRWQLNQRDGDGDIRHIGSFIDAVVKRTCADPRRVYMTGFSMGGSFSFRAGCELADKIAAIAPVSGSYRSQDPCPGGTRPMPTLELHGRDPWTETVPRLIRDMRSRNHCARPAITRRIAPGVTRRTWPGCNLARIYNRTVGHEWPKLGPYNTSVEVWKFVSGFRR